MYGISYSRRIYFQILKVKGLTEDECVNLIIKMLAQNVFAIIISTEGLCGNVPAVAKDRVSQPITNL